MIVCSCNYITDHDIRAVISKLKDKDPDAVLTVGKVYGALGKRPKCGACLKHAIEIIIAGTPG